jgi:hypothetical protein
MATTAEIQKYSHHQDGYVEYFIKVVHNGRVWGIRKRYSHFVQLHEHFIKNGYTIDVALPKKSWKKFDETRLKKRLKALQDYIDCLLRTFSLSDNSLLKEFFEVETVWLQIAKKQSFKEIQSAEKLTRLPKTLQTWMIAVPYTRNRSNTTGGYGRPPSANMQFMSPGFKDKTKSVSFSSFSLPMPNIGGRSMSRKESLAADLTPSGRDRRFSVDIFNLSYNSGNNLSLDHITAAASILKKGAFIKSTQVLWKHYQEEAQYTCEDANFLKPGCCGALPSDSASSENANVSPQILFQSIVQVSTPKKELSTVLSKVLVWEEECLKAAIDRSAEVIKAKSSGSLSLGIAAESISVMADDISLSEEEIIGIPIKDVVFHSFTQLRGSSHDSKMSAGTTADTESVGTSIESLSLKG